MNSPKKDRGGADSRSSDILGRESPKKSLHESYILVTEWSSWGLRKTEIWILGALDGYVQLNITVPLVRLDQQLFRHQVQQRSDFESQHPIDQSKFEI